MIATEKCLLDVEMGNKASNASTASNASNADSDLDEMKSLPVGGSAVSVAPAGGTQGGGRRKTHGHKKHRKGHHKGRKSHRRSKSRRQQ